MTDKRLADRYARAIFELAEENDCVAAWGKSLRELAAAVWNDPALKDSFLRARASLADKKKIARILLGEGAHPLLLNFVDLVLDRNRQSILPEIAEAYQNREDKKIGLKNITVYTPFALTEAKAEEITTQLKEELSCPVRLKTAVDKALIGGIVLQIGDKLYDGSVRHRLELLQKAMES